MAQAKPLNLDEWELEELLGKENGRESSLEDLLNDVDALRYVIVGERRTVRYA
jgi:hypothetical protein